MVEKKENLKKKTTSKKYQILLIFMCFLPKILNNILFIHIFLKLIMDDTVVLFLL